MIVLSCAKWLPHTIAGIAPFMDEIIIVHGATQEMVDLGIAKPSGDSTDDTGAVLERLAKKYGNIKIIPPKIYKHRNEQRNEYLKHATGDWIWVVDHDEFYHHEDILAVKEQMEEPRKVCIATKWIEFYTWTRRYKKAGPPMERIFRRSEGMYYHDKNSGQSCFMDNGQSVWKLAWGMKDNSTCYHYNRTLDPDELTVKLLYYATRDEGLNPSQLIAQRHERPSFKKTTEGTYVPLMEQPPAARGLMYTGIAPISGLLSKIDEESLGMDWQDQI